MNKKVKLSIVTAVLSVGVIGTGSSIKANAIKFSNIGKSISSGLSKALGSSSFSILGGRTTSKSNFKNKPLKRNTNNDNIELGVSSSRVRVGNLTTENSTSQRTSTGTKLSTNKTGTKTTTTVYADVHSPKPSTSRVLAGNLTTTTSASDNVPLRKKLGQNETTTTSSVLRDPGKTNTVYADLDLSSSSSSSTSKVRGDREKTVYAQLKFPQPSTSNVQGVSETASVSTGTKLSTNKSGLTTISNSSKGNSINNPKVNKYGDPLTGVDPFTGRGIYEDPKGIEYILIPF